MKTLPTILVVYVAMGIFTFGHSASHSQRTLRSDVGADAFIACIFWPLYWSWHFQAKE